LRVGIAWECPWTPSSYGKIALWLSGELQRLGFDVRVYCPSAPPVDLYGRSVPYKPSCPHKELGVCYELEKPVEVSNDSWVCEDSDVDAVVIGGSPYGAVEVKWVQKCSSSKTPVAGYFVTESAVVPPHLATWLFHVDAVAFPTRAVARAFLVYDPLRELHGDFMVVPHGFPDYYFRLTPQEVLDYVLSKTPVQGLEDALESRSAGRLIVNVAKDHPRKDFAALFSAFALLKRRTGDEKLRLLLGFVKAIGASVWDPAVLMYTLGLTERDVLSIDAKWQSNGMTELGLLTVYSLGNAFAFPSMGEGFGMPPIEASLLGLPHVTTRLPATVEVWGDYPLLVGSRPVLMSDGTILFSTDYRDMAEKLERALSDPEHYGRLAKNKASRYRASDMGRMVAGLVDKAVGNAGRKTPYPVPFEKWARVASGHAQIVLEALGLL